MALGDAGNAGWLSPSLLLLPGPESGTPVSPLACSSLTAFRSFETATG